MRTLAAAVTLVLLAGCAQKSAEEVRQQEEAKAAYMKTPEGQVEAICRFKADAAMASRRRGTLMDLGLVGEEMRLRKSCEDLFRQTGIMPTY